MRLPLVSLLTLLVTIITCEARASFDTGNSGVGHSHHHRRSLLSVHRRATRARRCSAPPTSSGTSSSSSADPAPTVQAASAPPPGECFPAKKPDGNGVPSVSPSGWWCSLDSENGFLGFTYGVSGCPDAGTLANDFGRMRSEFGARYVRMYGSCDYDGGFFDRFVTTAFQQGLGVYSTIWMDFDGSDSWRGRRERILNVIQNNPYAPYVVRSVDLGSEALFFHLLDAGSMANEINYIKSVVGRFGIKVSTSEIVYAYSQIDNAQTVLDAEEVLHAHPLPYFDPNVTYGSGARNSVFDPADWLVQHTGGSKKIIFTQTGWPTRYNAALPGGNPATVASADSAQAYAQLLDASCEDLKSRTPQGGVGYFWHSFNENAMDGWGVLDENGNTKYNFHPRTSC